MQVRIPWDKIRAAWPDGLHARFEARGVKPEHTSAPRPVGNIRFVEPCSCHWDDVTGNLVVDQPCGRRDRVVAGECCGRAPLRGSGSTRFAPQATLPAPRPGLRPTVRPA